MNKAKLIQRCNALGSPRILFWILPALMILLVFGTISQKYIGLYQSLNIFFDSWLIWVEMPLFKLPLPGFYPIMSIFAVNLLFRFLFKSPWVWEITGLHLTHFGALLLIIGGLFTAVTAQEHFLIIGEDEETSYMSDYHKRVLVIFDKNQTQQTAIPFETLKKMQTITVKGLQIKILSHCDNCKISERTDDDEGYQGMAEFMVLSPQALDPENEQNMAGLTLQINNQTYIAFEGMPQPIMIDEHQILLGKKQAQLPFTIYLKDFVKSNYAETAMARAFHSDIIVKDQDLEWPTTISMNKPLRYKGYTLYQSSYVQNELGEQTILHVVENKGRIFPYLSTLIMAVGLLLHLSLMLKQRRNST